MIVEDLMTVQDRDCRHSNNCGARCLESIVIAHDLATVWVSIGCRGSTANLVTVDDLITVALITV